MASFSHAHGSGLRAPEQSSQSARLRDVFPPRPKSVRVWAVHPEHAEHNAEHTALSTSTGSAPKRAVFVRTLCAAGILLVIACLAVLWCQSVGVIHLTK
jgi:hypothetical protein